MSAKATGASPQPNGNAQSRSHNDGSSSRAFTPEQKTAVVRIRSCKAHAYYAILDLESERATVSDAGIKKAYRKLSLLTHPDKNGYPGADEAFKLVSRAFQILSDAEKKAKYDKFGGDPDSRFGAGGAGAASGFSRSTAGANPFGFAGAGGGGGGGPNIFEEEISPEELFRQFFGGGSFGMGGPLFGGSGFGGSQFGGSGVRVYQFGGNRPRRRPPGTGGAQQEEPTPGMALLNLLPVIFIFVILPILSSLLGGGSGGGWGTSQYKPPPFNVDVPNNAKGLTNSRVTKRLGVEYFYNARDVENYSSKQWHQLDETAESKLIYTLEVQCAGERQAQQQLFQESQGWFSIDRDKEEQARRMEKPACERFVGLTRRGRGGWL